MTIARKYQLKLLTSGNEPSPLVVSGEGAFRFDGRKGTVLWSRFAGKLEFETDKEMRIVPLKYNYRPAGAGGAVQRRVGVFGAAGPRGVRGWNRRSDRPSRRPTACRSPSKEAREAAAALVEEAFGDECKAARSPSDKLAMVDKLIKAADGEKGSGAAVRVAESGPAAGRQRGRSGRGPPGRRRNDQFLPDRRRKGRRGRAASGGQDGYRRAEPAGRRVRRQPDGKRHRGRQVRAGRATASDRPPRGPKMHATPRC